MKSWQVRLGLLLLFLSGITYYIHYLIFNDLHHILLFLVGDVAFVFIEVLLVTLIIHSLLDRREREALIRKMSTVVGAFFSELGRPLILKLTLDRSKSLEIGQDLHISTEWTEKTYHQMADKIEGTNPNLKLGAKDLAELKDMLVEKRGFLLSLMENPNLLEHEKFTEMLLALFHVHEELMNRKDILSLPPADIAHLNRDVNRAFSLITREWLMHMYHLQKNYPYLFSLAVRTNPFDPNADSVVRE